MKKNLNNTDRLIRVFLGAVILIVAAQYGSWWGLLGLALVVTGAIGYCGLYDLVGCKTCCKDCATPETATTPAEQKPAEESEAKDDAGQQPPAAPQQ